MDIGLGMSVYTSDGQGIGSVDRLILDPDTNQVKAAVIRKGGFLPHDKEVIRELFDVLKVEAPVNLAFVEGTRAFRWTSAYTCRDAMRLFREAVSVATKPFIYLSAGVTAEVFRETLELAVEAGAPFAGVLCGRANWQGGVPAFARGGTDALMVWLEDAGVKNITALNPVVTQGARPWWTVHGGVDSIEVVEPM